MAKRSRAVKSKRKKQFNFRADEDLVDQVRLLADALRQGLGETMEMLIRRGMNSPGLNNLVKLEKEYREARKKFELEQQSLGATNKEAP